MSTAISWISLMALSDAGGRVVKELKPPRWKNHLDISFCRKVEIPNSSKNRLSASRRRVCSASVLSDAPGAAMGHGRAIFRPLK